MVFITAGMGGGTGTGAAPVVAQLAKELGILTVAVVTKPFPFEGRKRMQVARARASTSCGKHVDSLITIPNEKLLTVLGGDATLLDAFTRRERRAARRRAGHRRADHAAGPDQRRLRRRAHRDGARWAWR